MPEDKEMKTQLLTNRAAAQFYIENYRSSLRDCSAALVVTPSHMKAVVRGAQCCYKLKHYADCVTWCDRGLGLDTTQAELLKLRADSQQMEKTRQRDQRKKLADSQQMEKTRQRDQRK